MSEYTPSTEDIKWEYKEQCNHYYADCLVPAKEHAAEFDRWLAQHDAEVAKAERKRIAKKVWKEKQRVFEATVKDPTNSQLLAYQSGIWRVLDIIEGESE